MSCTHTNYIHMYNIYIYTRCVLLYMYTQFSYGYTMDESTTRNHKNHLIFTRIHNNTKNTVKSCENCKNNNKKVTIKDNVNKSCDC